ncbi:sugar-binding transcriptional regulator [Hutsoniella sourekii]
MEDQRIKDMVTAANLYYQEGKSQSQIAKEMAVSRPTVSRLLQTARDEGIVKISIKNPLETTTDLAQRLMDYLNIEVDVVRNYYKNQTQPLASVGLYAAEWLDRTITDGDKLGIGWGKTINEVAKHLIPNQVAHVQVTQLKGSPNYANSNIDMLESLQIFANNYHCSANYLPLPTIFDSQTTKDIVQADRFIRKILDLGRESDIALYTVGTVNPNALLFQFDFLDDPTIDYLKRRAAGDLLSHFIDQDGLIVNANLSNRTVGIGIEYLKEIKHSVLIASGSRKTDAVAAAVNGGYTNQLIIDETLAEALCHYYQLI